MTVITTESPVWGCVSPGMTADEAERQAERWIWQTVERSPPSLGRSLALAEKAAAELASHLADWNLRLDI